MQVPNGSDQFSLNIKYQRLHVNGCYMRYMMDIQHPTGEAIDQFLADQNNRCLHQASEVDTVHMWKARAVPAFISPPNYDGYATMASVDVTRQRLTTGTLWL